MGYSALLYNKGNTTGQGYCLPHGLRHTFHRLRVTLGISFCLLAFFLSISTPAALVGIYGRLRDKMARPDSNWLYFVWATVIIVMVITPLMAFVNIYFIVEFAAALTVYSQTLFLVYIVLLASAISSLSALESAASITVRRVGLRDFPSQVFSVFSVHVVKIQRMQRMPQVKIKLQIRILLELRGLVWI